ncbi:TetR/AcrR family transcriptional regulator [Psychromonas sp. 14N.309.X.WAT.B.A12]|uniref:TetR/AcrR family transcriptional regulator n=1 Tax=unclassified Psychromonas TaxID=2614957 RepID=UPI0025AF73C3|nr:TetR/AcrR family transcriptional regulator [Psychromonas sp. 14N.309.X.WAT.B.A12]MDN2662169.1 TetR/AcrR family transcriptional regulator [Psychromonas sp. 14N.309.X.WAT.B.A12]
MSKVAKFDREEVIQKATNLYWGKGYHGTSMRNLQTAIDLRPGSIYATFGSKDNLFKESIQYYANKTGEVLENCLAETSSPLEGLKLFIRKLVIENLEGKPSCMCMIVKSISELTDADNKELLDEAKLLLANVENKFAEIITEAIKLGEIASDKDAKELASYIQVQIIGLRTYARVNSNVETINKFVNEIFIGSPFH